MNSDTNTHTTNTVKNTYTQVQIQTQIHKGDVQFVLNQNGRKGGTKPVRKVVDMCKLI